MLAPAIVVNKYILFYSKEGSMDLVALDYAQESSLDLEDLIRVRKFSHIFLRRIFQRWKYTVFIVPVT